MTETARVFLFWTVLNLTWSVSLAGIMLARKREENQK